MAVACYALAATFRANGLLLVGFILWNLFWQDPRPTRRQSLMCAPALVLISISPVLLTQAFAYARLCSTTDDKRDWCNKMVPSVYTFVQQHYW